MVDDFVFPLCWFAPLLNPFLRISPGILRQCLPRAISILTSAARGVWVLPFYDCIEEDFSTLPMLDYVNLDRGLKNLNVVWNLIKMQNTTHFAHWIVSSCIQIPRLS